MTIVFSCHQLIRIAQQQSEEAKIIFRADTSLRCKCQYFFTLGIRRSKIASRSIYHLNWFLRAKDSGLKTE